MADEISDDQQIYEMLTENTGTSILDSGGAYGRGWERNQKKSLEDFKNEDQVTWEIWSGDLDATVSLFHHLTSELTLDDLCREFNSRPVENWDGPTYGVSKSGGEWLEKRGFVLGEAVNSYNGESNLSQIIQYTPTTKKTEYGEEFYVLLQIHNGCDARGGYTDAKLFWCCEQDYGFPYLDTNPDVYGVVDGINVSSSYDGWQLTVDDADHEIGKFAQAVIFGRELESGEKMPVRDTSKVEPWTIYG